MRLQVCLQGARAGAKLGARAEGGRRRACKGRSPSSRPHRTGWRQTAWTMMQRASADVTAAAELSTYVHIAGEERI